MANVVVSNGDRRMAKLSLDYAKIHVPLRQLHRMGMTKGVRIKTKAGEVLNTTEYATEVGGSQGDARAGRKNTLVRLPAPTEQIQTVAQAVGDAYVASPSTLAFLHHQNHMAKIYVVNVEVDKLLRAKPAIV